MFQAINLVRIIQIFIIQLGLGIYYLVFGLMILRRDTKRINLIFSGYFFSVFIGTIINVIYAPLTINPVVLILHYITMFFLVFGNVFILVFLLILMKSEKIINTKKQIIILVVYAALVSVLIFIPGGVTIDESTEWKPVWSLPFVIYLMILRTCYVVVPTFYFSIKIYKEFENKILKKRWAFFVIGWMMYMIYGYSLSISNYLDIDLVRTIVLGMGLLLFLTAILLYYGVGRQIEK